MADDKKKVDGLLFPSTTIILLADDMRTMRNLVRQVLTDLSYTTVTECEDGAAAWKEIETASALKMPYQLIISDWAMPKVTGLDLLKKVRMTEAVKNTPFLMITAEADAVQVKEAISSGVSNYITKPFTADTVKTKLAAVWKRHNPA
jgi:two-component system chemotaxis response regulator CheY